MYYIKSWWNAAQHRLSGYPAWTIELGLYGCFGLLCGFIGKNLGKVIIYGLIGAVFLLWLFNYLQLLTLNVVLIKHYFGIESAQSIDDVLRIYISWMRLHIIACVSWTIGFFIGWRLG